jgi:hypothetical protein
MQQQTDHAERYSALNDKRQTHGSLVSGAGCWPCSGYFRLGRVWGTFGTMLAVRGVCPACFPCTQGVAMRILVVLLLLGALPLSSGCGLFSRKADADAPMPVAVEPPRPPQDDVVNEDVWPPGPSPDEQVATGRPGPPEDDVVNEDVWPPGPSPDERVAEGQPGPPEDDVVNEDVWPPGPSPDEQVATGQPGPSPGSGSAGQ